MRSQASAHDGHLIVILSSACGQYSKLQTLVNALDAMHAETASASKFFWLL